jgi:hypothetical protein
MTIDLNTLKTDLIYIRDEALKQDAFDWAVRFSHYIAAINTGAISLVPGGKQVHSFLLLNLRNDLKEIVEVVLDVQSESEAQLQQRLEAAIAAIEQGKLQQVAEYIPAD